MGKRSEQLGATPTRGRRTWRQRVLRGAIGLALVLTAAYLFLPAWLPTDWLRAKIETHLTETLGVRVNINRLNVSWGDGILLEGLTIDSPPSPTGQTLAPMVRIEQVRCDFSPLDLLKRQCEWIDVRGLRVNVYPLGEGKWNTDSLSALQSDGGESKFQVGRLCVWDATLRATLAPNTKAMVLHIGDFQMHRNQAGGPLDRVLMTARLEQRDGDAPLIVRVTPSSPVKQIVAQAGFHFSNLDLAQLPREALLPTWFASLAGRCRGALAISMNSEGRMDDFSLDVRIADLDVQLTDTIDTPPIDKAQLIVHADFDALSNKLTLEDARVRLPGLDLAGKGVLYPEFDQKGKPLLDDIDVYSLALKGTVRPERVLAVFTGKDSLSDKTDLRGPIELDVALAREPVENSPTATQLTCRATIDARNASWTQTGRLLKPAHLPAGIRFTATYHEHTDVLDLGQLRLHFGENSFSAAGKIQDLRKPWAAKTPREAMGLLSRVTLQGAIEITKPKQLWLLPDLATPAPQGLLTGTWSLQGGPHPQWGVSLRSGPEKPLTWAGRFTKPTGKEISLDFSGALDPAQGQLLRISLDGFAAGGRVSLNDVSLQLPDANTPARLRGSYEIRDPAKFLACLPMIDMIEKPLPAFAGTLRGTFSAKQNRPGTDAMTLDATGDLRDVSVQLGDWFRKDAGQQSNFEFHAQVRDTKNLQNNLYQGTLQLEETNMTFAVGRHALEDTAALDPKKSTRPATSPSPSKKIDGAHITLHAKDLSWLRRHTPRLARAFGNADTPLHGSVDLALQFAQDPASPLSAKLWLTGKGNHVTLTMKNDQGKDLLRLREKPLALSLRGAVQWNRPTGKDEMGLLVARNWNMDASLGASHIALRDGDFSLPSTMPGLTTTPTPSPATQKPPTDLWANATAKMGLHWELDADELLGEIIPAARPWVKKYQIAGKASSGSSLSWGRKGLALGGRVDATRLAFHLPGDAGKAKRFSKPAGLIANANWQLTWAPTTGAITLSHLAANLGAIHLSATANASATRDATGHLAYALGEGQCQWVVSEAGTLATILPAVFAKTGEARPAGRVEGTLAWKAVVADKKTGTKAGLVASASVKLDSLRGSYRGKKVSLNGSARIRGLHVETLHKPRVTKIDHVFSDGLELRAGENLGWLLADATWTPGAPTGSATILIANLDSKDLSDWLGVDEATLEGQPPTAKTSAAATENPSPLTPDEQAALKSQAIQKLHVARDAIADANFTLKLKGQSLAVFSEDLNETFHIDGIDLALHAHKGAVDLTYDVGLNGGTASGHYITSLLGEDPQLVKKTAFVELKATAEIQKMVEAEFPGNTVRGLFSQQADVELPLAAMLANMEDSRYPLIKIGEGKVVATQGEVVGQAAPEFVTKIFPDLRLSKNPYDIMTSFSKYRPDGTSENETIFEGKYDLYMEGTTSFDKKTDYTLGLILLAKAATPEEHRAWRQGRIPLMKTKGVIVNRVLADVVVTYPWPTETLFTIFLKNNLFYRAWVVSHENKQNPQNK